ADHRPEKVVFPNTGTTYDPEYIRGKRIVAFAGIARPDVFHRTLMEMGAEVVYFEGYGDHHPFTIGEIAGLDDKKRQMGADCLLTTEKDWWRLGMQADQWEDMGFLQIEFSLIDGKESLFELIRDRVRKRRVI
ncbi:MAG: tetraacyldisaccharide 4'-kinase, partial [Deltaproteobacteria bacterium]|nr:tetraacyldisaccharide 4'-kinase [Deltaproteobacteria bacterium]